MDAEQINSRSDGQSKPNSEVKADEDTIDDHGLDQSIKRKKVHRMNLQIKALTVIRMGRITNFYFLVILH